MPFEFIGNVKRNYLNKKSKIPQKKFSWLSSNSGGSSACNERYWREGHYSTFIVIFDLWPAIRENGKNRNQIEIWIEKSLLGNLYIFHFQRENFSQVFAFDIETIFLGNLHLYAIRSLVASNPRAPLENPPLVSSSPPSSNPSVAIPFPPPSYLIRLLAFLFIALLIYVSHQNR